MTTISEMHEAYNTGYADGKHESNVEAKYWRELYNQLRDSMQVFEHTRSVSSIQIAANGAPDTQQRIMSISAQLLGRKMFEEGFMQFDDLGIPPDEEVLGRTDVKWRLRARVIKPGVI